jgi:hypothetical protein
MNPASERRLALGILLAVLLINAVALSAELYIGAVNGSDNVGHWAMIQGMTQAVETGANPLDFWSPELAFGAPAMRTYQPLAHALVVLAWFAMGKTVSLLTVFLWVRYLAIVLLPAAFFAAATLLDLPPLTAAAAAILAPLIATNNFYGLDYSSYVTIGRGLFPQSVAAILLLLAIGYGYRAVRYGRHCVIAGLLTGLTCVCHFIYGWIAAVTIILIALLPGDHIARILRLRRAIAIGAIALLVSAFQILPVLRDAPILNHSRFEGQWKWDSFGAVQVLQYLFTGQLLDYGRPPVLLLLALAGCLAIAWHFYNSRRLPPAPKFILAGSLLWLLVFFGRPTWGPLLLLLGTPSDLHLHRTVAALQLFLVLLAAIGLTALLRELANRVHIAASLVVAILALGIMLTGRARYLSQDEAGGKAIAASFAAEQDTLDSVIANVKQAGGRVYAGLGTTWGPKFNIGGIPFFDFLETSLVPQTSTSHQLLALPSDLIVSFDESRPAEYRLFGIRSVVAPAGLASTLPPFLTLRSSLGRYRIFDAPPTGYFDVVDVAAAVPTNRTTFHDLNDRWLRSAWPEKKAHLWLDFQGDAPTALPRLPIDASFSQEPAATSSAGEIAGQSQTGQQYSAAVSIARPSFVLFKMTWHPNWKAYVDGAARTTAMLSPGFIGIPVDPGPHRVLLRYEPGWWKLWLAFFGLAASIALALLEKKGRLQSLLRPLDAAPEQSLSWSQHAPTPPRPAPAKRHRRRPA